VVDHVSTKTISVMKILKISEMKIREVAINVMNSHWMKIGKMKILQIDPGAGVDFCIDGHG